MHRESTLSLYVFHGSTNLLNLLLLYACCTTGTSASATAAICVAVLVPIAAVAALAGGLYYINKRRHLDKALLDVMHVTDT